MQRAFDGRTEDVGTLGQGHTMLSKGVSCVAPRKRPPPVWKVRESILVFVFSTPRMYHDAIMVEGSASLVSCHDVRNRPAVPK